MSVCPVCGAHVRDGETCPKCGPIVKDDCARTKEKKGKKIKTCPKSGKK